MTRDVKKKSKITEENVMEAARLREIWDRTYEERRKTGLHSQGAFGAAYDIGNQAAVGFFLAARSALSMKAAKGFATGLGCKIEDFSPRIAADIASMTAHTGGEESAATELQQVVTRLTTSGKMKLTEVEAMVAMLKAREGSAK